MLLNLSKLKQEYNMKVSGILHIGAHYGQEYEIYRNLFGSVPIMMWEASESNFKVLSDKLKDENNLILINSGIGSFECAVKLYKETANQGMSNSVLKPSFVTEQYPHIIFNEVEHIELYPLDRWETGPTYNFLNIDIQGFELHAFLGAKKTLQNVNYIIAEVNSAELYEGCARVEEIDWYLNRWGFRRAETDWTGHTWGDAFYIRS